MRREGWINTYYQTIASSTNLTKIILFDRRKGKALYSENYQTIERSCCRNNRLLFHHLALHFRCNPSSLLFCLQFCLLCCCCLSLFAPSKFFTVPSLFLSLIVALSLLLNRDDTTSQHISSTTAISLNCCCVPTKNGSGERCSTSYLVGEK